MKGNIYTDIAEDLRRLGGIDRIGVVSASGESAIIYSGNKKVRKYYGGGSKQSLIFSVSAMDINSRQEAVVEKLCGIGERLTNAVFRIDGISQPSVRINSLPSPTMHNEKYIIYTSSIEFTFYMKG